MNQLVPHGQRWQVVVYWRFNGTLPSNELWQSLAVYLSGHETPGEGEHKIMDFIRYERSQAAYNPNTRHCFFGLDTDLIILMDQPFCTAKDGNCWWVEGLVAQGEAWWTTLC